MSSASTGPQRAESVTASAPSALDRLRSEPSRFSLDQAAAVIAPGLDPVDIAFRTVTRLGAPAGEVETASPDSAELVTPTFGLIGPGGVLPRHYAGWVEAENRQHSTALHAFLDLLSRRFTGLFVKAGAKYRPTRNPRHVQEVLSSAIGLGTPHLAHALRTPMEALLHHGGALASRTRSAERLRGMLTEETGYKVRITEFAGGWMRLPRTEQTRLSAVGQHARLGIDASIGVQVWDPSARFIVSLGPMPLDDFRSLLPDTGRFARLVEVTRLLVGLEQEFVLNPVLAPQEVPLLQLAAPRHGSGARLGWTSWLSAPRPRTKPAADAMLNPRSAT